MRIAVFSDLHANRQAWRAVHEDMLQQGVEALVCLGDIVGYGPEPQEVLNAVRAATEDIVLGNHDAVIGGLMDSAEFNDHARDIIEWTRGQLDEASAAFCAQLPESLEANGVLYTHAEAADPLRFNYIDTPEEALESFTARPEALIFIGHTHVPCVFAYNIADGTVSRRTHHRLHMRPHERHLVNVGSVGEPRDGDPRASYVIFDDEARTLEFRRVAFDVDAYMADLDARGLRIEPAFLAAHRYLLEHPGEAPGSAVRVVRAQPAMKNKAVSAEPPPPRPTTGPRRRVVKLGTKPRVEAEAPPAGRPSKATPPPAKSRLPALIVSGLLAVAAGGGFWGWKHFAQKPPSSAPLPPVAAAPAVPEVAEKEGEVVAVSTGKKDFTQQDGSPGTVWLIRFGKGENLPAEQAPRWNSLLESPLPKPGFQWFWKDVNGGRSMTATLTEAKGPLSTSNGGVTKEAKTLLGQPLPAQATRGAWSSDGAEASITLKLSGLNPQASYVFLPLLNGAMSDRGAVKSWSVQGAADPAGKYQAEKVEGFDLSTPVKPSLAGTMILKFELGGGKGTSGLNVLGIKELNAAR